MIIRQSNLFEEILNIQSALLCIYTRLIGQKNKQQKFAYQILKFFKELKSIKSQLINQIIYICNNSYFNIFLFNIIGNNSSEKPNN